MSKTGQTRNAKAEPLDNDRTVDALKRAPGDGTGGGTPGYGVTAPL